MFIWFLYYFRHILPLIHNNKVFLWIPLLSHFSIKNGRVLRKKKQKLVQISCWTKDMKFPAINNKNSSDAEDEMKTEVIPTVMKEILRRITRIETMLAIIIENDRRLSEEMDQVKEQVDEILEINRELLNRIPPVD
ncbi:unnamed protein product [Cylicocyclus nassatus]|uniref:Uncharacterized protein n=1 Tax=Cylicocyclus nassatus TaxID=53992 RepID=A0AA36GS13_CYLNA|nr:unnamed protein product [Cylicocyclus nassatus]